MPAPLDRLRDAPLVPYALAATAGLCLDRFVGVPLFVGLAVAAGTFFAARCSAVRGVLVLIGVACLAASWHALVRLPAANDLARQADTVPRLVRVRGWLADEPSTIARPADPLSIRGAGFSTLATLAATEMQTGAEWLSVGGRVRLRVEGALPDLHVGDRVELLGWLGGIDGPSNPGERDPAASLRDRGIFCELNLRREPPAIVRIDAGGPSLVRWLALLRNWGHDTLARRLPAEQVPLATALLLGDGSALSRDDWQRYVRTGVVHVLAISGQHLVVLAWFGWLVAGMVGVRRRPAAVAIALGLLLYALVTGGRPPIMRAAITVLAVAGAICLRRPVLPVNLLALAWLMVLILDPTDPFTPGCQLSFLGVIVLGWGLPRWLADDSEPDPLDKLERDLAPWWWQLLGRFGAAFGRVYLAAALVTLAVLPLVTAWYQLLTPVAFIIGPVVVALSSLALLAGFVVLLLDPIGGAWLTAPFAWLASTTLAGCDGLVTLADMRWGWWYVGPIPLWWTLLLYVALLTTIIPAWSLRVRWPVALAALGWLVVGLAVTQGRPPSGELRVTFLAVGHGGCTVIETPDGRVLLYDAGSLAGPSLGRRIVAPFLWQRGITRIDDVLLSHADLDHFNGLAELVERFAIGQVTATPSFAERSTPAVRRTLTVLAQAGIPWRVAQAGERLQVGAVTLEVLHPPPVGPAGPENVRSLTMCIRHLGHSLLLTGDLEGVGQAELLAGRPLPVDVLMAPHHGSAAANGPELLRWATPRLVVSSREAPGIGRPAPRVPATPPHWSTGTHGAITFRSSAAGLTATAFRTGERLVLRRPE